MKKFVAFLMLGVLALALVGCGNKKAEAEPEPELKKEQEKAEETSAWPRTIENYDGTETVLEKKPEKIAVLHFSYIEYLLALDAAPFATTSKEAALDSETMLPFAKEIDEMVDLGSVTAPNLEELLTIKPDVIIAGAFQEDILENLRKIAPVIVDKRRENINMTWQDTLTYYGGIVGEEEKAQAYIAETEKVIADTHKELEKYQDKTFVFLAPVSKGQFVAMGTESFIEHYFDKGFGLQVPVGYPKEADYMSLEGLADLNPDYIYFQDKKPAIDEALAQLEQDKVWQNLKAVKDNHVGVLDMSLNTGSPLAIDLAAKNIVKSLEK